MTSPRIAGLPIDFDSKEEPPRIVRMSPPTLEPVAHHEAGHLLVGKMFFNVVSATIVPDERALGRVNVRASTGGRARFSVATGLSCRSAAALLRHGEIDEDQINEIVPWIDSTPWRRDACRAARRAGVVPQLCPRAGHRARTRAGGLGRAPSAPRVGSAALVHAEAIAAALLQLETIDTHQIAKCWMRCPGR